MLSAILYYEFRLNDKVDPAFLCSMGFFHISPQAPTNLLSPSR